MNWLSKEAAKADPSEDLAIIENSEARAALDEMLTAKFAPQIWDILKATGYRVLPEVPAVRRFLHLAAIGFGAS